MSSPSISRRLLPQLAALLALALPAVSPAQESGGGAADTAHPSPACCLRSSSPATAALARVGTDADETFFMSKPAPPNVMFVLDTSGSMFELPIDPDKIQLAARGNGCEAAAYDAPLSAGAFSMSGNYPPPDLGVSSAWNGDPGFPDLFHQAEFYRRGWTDAWDHDGWDEDGVAAGAISYTSAHGACANVPDSAGGTASNGTAVTSRHAQCEACLAAKGYYLDTVPASHASWDGSWRNWSHQVFSGKFLNFYPPKFVVARTTLKQVIWDLREVRFALTVFSGETGGKLITGMAPGCDKAMDPEDLTNSDQANAWTNSRKSCIQKTKDLKFGGSTPIAETLLDVGQFFTTKETFVDWFGSEWWDDGFKDGQGVNEQGRAFCWGCQVSAVVAITDGAPCSDNCVPEEIQEQSIGCTGCDQRDCGPGGGCHSSCGGGHDNCTASTNQLDDVTKWFSDHDLQTKNPNNGSWSADGRQKLIAYNVGFGLDHPLLKNAAQVTGGLYYTASDGASLKAALLDAIADINRRATAFGISSISTLQTTTSNASATVPRFIPDQPGQPWKGMLYRFNVVNEFVNGCKPTADTETADSKDIDGDHRCVSILYTDADDDLVEEDPTSGVFMKKGTGLLARPVWEAGRELTYQSPTYSEPETSPLRDPDSRSLWTVIDSNDDGRIDSDDHVIEFDAAHAEELMPYLQISADITRDSICTSIANVYGVPADDPSISAADATATSDPRHSWGKKCAEVIIEYYRGRKSLDLDPNERSKTRPWLLGDIFHSSPIVVEPPIAPEACQYFKQQCVSSLFDSASASGSASIEAYRGYLGDAGGPCGGVPCEKRRKILLVGANDGFIHAFDYGGVRSPETREQVTDRLVYDDGTGRELWGFIPPDLLGSLKHTTGKHAYYVDGTAMVRDIWVDGDALSDGDGARAKDEFHTVAIVGERTGGSHFFALDLTEDLGTAATKKPTFLWMWPQPCDPMIAQVGESLSNFVPKPPPIMPVLLDAESTNYQGGFSFKHREWDADTEAWKDDETAAQERWVVMLNGGYDKYLTRGRGVSMVDAWNGATLWDAFYDPSASDLRKQLLSPVPA
jgi:type IV pilus assembly protein PilY1